MNYLNQFLQLICCTDVLEVVNPLGNKAVKEITESMAMIRPIKKITLAEPMKYGLVDFCAGNALTSVLAVYLAKVAWAVAIDKRERKRKWNKVRRFNYLNADIVSDIDITKWNNDNFALIAKPKIFIAVHACGRLSERVIELYNECKSAQHLIMMPCCEDNFKKNNNERGLNNILTKYQLWVYHLAKKCNGYFYFDKYCMSPKNGIIVASK